MELQYDPIEKTEKYGIEWKTPAEMNPNINFD